jgi:hypothetical protein
LSLIRAVWRLLFGTIGRPPEVMPEGERPAPWALLIIVALGHAALALAIGFLAAIFSALDVWLVFSARLLVPLAVATLLGSLSLVIGSRVGWAMSLVATTVALALVALASVPGAELMAVAAIVLMVGNIVALWVVRRLFAARRSLWREAWIPLIVGMSIVWAVFADPLPAAPMSVIRPEGVATWNAAHLLAATRGRILLPLPGSPFSASEVIALGGRGGSDIRSPTGIQPGAIVLAGTDPDGHTWYAITMGRGDPNLGTCERIDGPGWRRGSDILVQMYDASGRAENFGLLLPIGPELSVADGALTQDRFRGSFCLDDEGRVIDYGAPYLFGY